MQWHKDAKGSPFASLRCPKGIRRESFDLGAQRPSVGVGESSEVAVGDRRRAVGVGGSVATLVPVATLVLNGMLVLIGTLVGTCVGVGDNSEIVVCAGGKVGGTGAWVAPRSSAVSPEIS